MNRKMSNASKRASNYPNRNDEWLCTFEYTPAKGLGLEEGVHRRDPSSIIKVNDTYYVYYTKSIGAYVWDKSKGKDWKLFPWDYADIWYATSKDGVNWTEQGIATARGKKGDYDDRTVCTPDVMALDGKYYLVYQTISSDETYTGGNEKVGMSIADSPGGPFKKVETPILAPTATEIWFDETDTYNAGEFSGTVHDPMLFYYKNKFYLYYKCGAKVGGRQVTGYAGCDTRWGVAISDNVKGPYIPSEYNPVTNSGHETLLWEYKGGIAALINRDGPEANTIQYAEDGINFDIVAVTQFTPQAGGAYRCENTDAFPLAGLEWGLCHVDERASQWNYIFRFDTLPRQADTFPKNYPPNK